MVILTVPCCTKHASTLSANQSLAHLQPNVLQKRMVQALPGTATPRLEPASNASALAQLVMTF